MLRQGRHSLLCARCSARRLEVKLFVRKACRARKKSLEYASAAGDAPCKRSEAGLKTPIWQAAGWPNQGLTSFAGSVEYAFLAGGEPRARSRHARRSTLYASPEPLFNNRSGNSCGRLSMRG